MIDAESEQAVEQIVTAGDGVEHPLKRESAGGEIRVGFHVWRKLENDFSFLGGILRWGFILALVLIVAGVLLGFELGTYFSVAMVGLAGGAILYDTSNILRVYPEDRYVAAAPALFASVALMFWYVLRLFLAGRR